ncbi:MAG: M20/M25/M40 family metallo-hydrolase [Gemmatimonadetes bacterium]|nr:M20/M25/M40 family metallo-hydrolase [Gemmatimonadota bacterium]
MRARTSFDTLSRVRRLTLALLLPALAHATAAQAQVPASLDWGAIEAETMRHFQTLLRFDTSDPPGNERPAAEYLRDVLAAEGIEVELYELEPNLVNVVARIRGNGSRRPLLLMAHTDVVNVDPAKWTHPPFSATREGGYVYGRGTVDDKDNVVTALMPMLLLQRTGVALGRDVIFLAEAGEEGTTRVGIQYMVKQHFDLIDAEFCLAEGGGMTREGGEVRFASVQLEEKIPRAIELVARGASGHGSVPLETNPLVRLSNALGRVAAWSPPLRMNETLRSYFTRLIGISSPDQAMRYASLLSSSAESQAAAVDWLFRNEPRHAAMVRPTLTPTMIDAGYRVNVIPSEATSTIDVRLHADEDPTRFLDMVRAVVADSSVEVRYGARDVRPGASNGSIGSQAFTAIERAVRTHYGVVTLPTMSTGATDMAYLRARGVECYGIGPATDVEDGPLGFGSHSDQERILESELHRFVRFHWDVVTDLAGAR